MISNLKDKLKKKKKKSGIQSLTLIVGVLIAFVTIAGLFDLTSLQTKFSTLSAQTGYVSRVVSRQGGVNTELIPNYHGRYVTSSELYRNVRGAMNNAGIKDNEFKVVVAGHTLSPTTQTMLFDYGEKIPVTIAIKYNWDFLSSFMPVLPNDRQTTVEVVSTYNIREGGFSEAAGWGG